MKINQKEVDKLSVDELNRLMDMIKSALKTKREGDYAAARKKIDEIAKSVGLSASELVEQTEKPAPKPQKEDYYP